MLKRILIVLVCLLPLIASLPAHSQDPPPLGAPLKVSQPGGPTLNGVTELSFPPGTVTFNGRKATMSSTGATGAPGPTGPTGPTGATGTTGATGSTGSTGATGADGATWRSGSGAPSDGTGVNGDYYFRTDTSDVYKRVSGTYSVVANIKGATGTTGSTGATGATGAAGADGKTVRNGSGVPSGGLGVDGDFYIDATAHSIYGPKASGAWGRLYFFGRANRGYWSNRKCRGDGGDGGNRCHRRNGCYRPGGANGWPRRRGTRF